MKYFFNIKFELVSFLNTLDFTKIGVAILVIFVWIAFSKLFSKFLIRVLEKLTRNVTNPSGSGALSFLEAPANLLIVSIGLYLSADILDFSNGINVFIGKVFRTLIVFSVAYMLYSSANSFNSFLGKLFKNVEVTSNCMLISFFKKGLKVIIVMLSIVVIVGEWGYNVSGLVAGLGLGGLAFALAAKDTVSNVFGSLVIITDRPFEIGDWILTSDIEGVVTEIGFRSTRVRTFSEALVTIPNSVLSNSTITNYSKMGKRRIKFVLNLKYNTDISVIKEFLQKTKELLVEHPKVLKDANNVVFNTLGNNHVEILVSFFTTEVIWQDYLNVQQDVNFKIMAIMKEIGVLDRHE